MFERCFWKASTNFCQETQDWDSSSLEADDPSRSAGVQLEFLRLEKQHLMAKYLFLKTEDTPCDNS